MHVSCSWMQFLEWYKKLEFVEEEVPNFEVDLACEITRTSYMFKAE